MKKYLNDDILADRSPLHRTQDGVAMQSLDKSEKHIEVYSSLNLRLLRREKRPPRNDIS